MVNFNTLQSETAVAFFLNTMWVSEGRKISGVTHYHCGKTGHLAGLCLGKGTIIAVVKEQEFLDDGEEDEERDDKRDTFTYNMDDHVEESSLIIWWVDQSLKSILDSYVKIHPCAFITDWDSFCSLCFMYMLLRWENQGNSIIEYCSLLLKMDGIHGMITYIFDRDAIHLDTNI